MQPNLLCKQCMEVNWKLSMEIFNSCIPGTSMRRDIGNSINRSSEYSRKMQKIRSWSG